MNCYYQHKGKCLRISYFTRVIEKSEIKLKQGNPKKIFQNILRIQNRGGLNCVRYCKSTSSGQVHPMRMTENFHIERSS